MHDALARLEHLIAVALAAQRADTVSQHVVAASGIAKRVERRQTRGIVRKGVDVVARREGVCVPDRKERHLERDEHVLHGDGQLRRIVDGSDWACTRQCMARGSASKPTHCS